MELKLCESEYCFMSIIWDNEPLASGDLVKLCNRELGWKKSTTYTLLKRMTERGFAKNEDYTVTSCVPREEVQRFASESFVEKTFSGSLPSFLVAFFDGKRISDSEAEELKRLIDEYKSEDSEIK
ncbi:MAG: BlaI/MecI/CopY family transcriptional regulator [Ruminococcaceae bacterium]|nr:BlaI/MecI/CopY family transcriptional regulator [Oscillospiraceae bacterium]